jgi:lipase ATG15
MKLRKLLSYRGCREDRAYTGLLLGLLAVSANPAVAGWTERWRTSAEALVLPVIQPGSQKPLQSIEPNLEEREYRLQNIFHHGARLYPNLHRRLDIRSDEELWTEAEEGQESERLTSFKAKASLLKIERLRNRKVEHIQPLLDHAEIHGYSPSLPMGAWTVDDLAGPNITDKDTVINLALMAANAYDINRKEAEWEDVQKPYNYSQSFGWEGDGLRGHVFATKDNSSIVVSIKGTSPALFDGAETTTNDKINDNLFFGCCCGKGNYLWKGVCDCMTSTYTCNQTCLVKNLRKKDKYYAAAVELFGNVTELYPDSEVWLVGHSLGGAVSGLLGLTFGVPVVTFEAPGDRLPASRLGLPLPPGSTFESRQYTGAYHFGHTADPVFMGSCNTINSICTLGGYSMESQCHSGSVCSYDTVTDKNWRVHLSYHSIRPCIKDVYRAYEKLPECVPEDSECGDCALWKYYESNGTESTTTSARSTSTTSTLTRTETCKTPGFWGCLDESTTTSMPEPTYTTTITTTTCIRWGWFGCNEDVSTTMTITNPRPSPTNVTTTSVEATITSPTSTCTSPGMFYGCNDKKTPKTHTTPLHTKSPTSTLKSSTCKTPGFFFGCHDKTKALPHGITPAPVFEEVR